MALSEPPPQSKRASNGNNPRRPIVVPVLLRRQDTDASHKAADEEVAPDCDVEDSLYDFADFLASPTLGQGHEHHSEPPEAVEFMAPCTTSLQVTSTGPGAESSCSSSSPQMVQVARDHIMSGRSSTSNAAVAACTVACDSSASPRYVPVYGDVTEPQAC